MPKFSNADFPTSFANLNNLFDLVSTLNRSSVAPTDVVAGQVWVDSGNQNKIKIRNAANNGWIDTQLKIDQAYFGLDPAIAQYNANQIQGKSVSNTAPVSGQALVFNGTTYIPKTSGRVLQVVVGQTSTQATTSSATLSSIGLSASITPQFANSRILVMVNINGLYRTFSGGSNSIFLSFLKNGAAGPQIATLGTDSAASCGGASGTWLDSPNTTSAVTYGVGFLNAQAYGAVYSQYFGTSTSTITLMEIAN